MRKTALSLILFLLSSALLVNGPALGFEAKRQDCSKCHTLTPTEAKDLIKGLYPDARIVEVGISPLKAAWEVFVDVGGRKGILYIDFSKKHLILGSIVSLRDRKNLTQERFNELNRIDVSQIPLDDALVMGDPKARIRVIVFTDPD
jgi:thiol:disulfide interchange protein DsbC